jgi:chemotaxis methyl-accepting protein methylase
MEAGMDEAPERLKIVVFPRILRNRPANAAIRVWVAGCGTGEEAFSMAISLQEYLNETGAAFPVRIFASDASLPAIEKARHGRYPENIAADLTHERLSRYFTKVEGGYQVGNILREMCVFARHNLIDDPPFSKLDLISFRNVPTYVGGLQKDIIRLFHYALKPAGFLMLGASEAAGSGDLFSVVDREQRIYARRETARKPQRLRAANRELQSLNQELIAVNGELEALRRSEEHLRQSRNMEAVGKLAGGIAHDFNNLLTAIIGYSDLLQGTLAGNQPAIQQVLEIRTAGQRAAALTQELLALSRRQAVEAPKAPDS